MDAERRVHVCRDPRYALRVNGELVRFSFNPWYEGSLVVYGPDGKRLKRQPGPRSAFSAAWSRWFNRNHRRFA